MEAHDRTDFTWEREWKEVLVGVLSFWAAAAPVLAEGVCSTTVPLASLALFVLSTKTSMLQCKNALTVIRIPACQHAAHKFAKTGHF